MYIIRMQRLAVEQSRSFLRGMFVVFCVCLVSVFVFSSVGNAESLSNSPMETKIQAAPANIMFLLDNSGSMDWEFMTAETDGKFGGDNYIFNLSDNAYSGVLAGTELIEWKSQWSGYNGIYYNPLSEYHPWPDWEKMDSTQAADGTTIFAGGTSPPHEADMKDPRSNPIYSTPTVNMFATFYPNVPITDFIIVDDSDGSPAFTTTGSWGSSSLTPEWDGDSLITHSEGDNAVFTPNITSADNYSIFAWWNCYVSRDQNALIEVDVNGDGVVDGSERQNQSSSVNNVPEAGVCGEWLPLFGGANFPFASGQNGSVTITRDTPNGSSTVADAIAFIKVGSSTFVDINNAHYYAVNDIDGDGAESGEVYLVNFEWNDADADTQVDDGEISRNYYMVKFSSSTTNRERVMSLSHVDYDVSDQGNDDVPDEIQPTQSNEDGTETFLTDMEDLQNFTNWFSFYRRRELTAKAAVARTINGLEWVNVGYYTLHATGGVRQTVLPIKVEASNEIIVDDGDSGFTSSSGWSWSGSHPEYGTNSRYSGSNGAWSKWTPNITTAGDYEVFAWWNCYTNRDQKAMFTISHSGTTTIKYLNQRAASSNTVTTKTSCEDSAGSGCCGYWVSLGTYAFVAGNTDYVSVERHGSSTGSSTVADAIKFVGSGSVNVDETNSLLDDLYSIDSDNGTPLRLSLLNIGRYFDQDDGQTGNLGTSPYVTEAEGGSCQQAFAIAMTDGYWNGGSPGVNNQDSGEGAPYQDGYSNTLADVAWKFYDDDLADGLPNDMPTNNYDKSKTQHMVTYGVSFGLSGSIDQDDIDGDGDIDDPLYADDPYFLNPDTTMPTWPDPTTSCSACTKKIDDLWHASVNGRGRFFQANDPDSLVLSLNELFEDISSRTASGASVSVNGDELSTGLVLYQSSYEAGVWNGNVSAYPIDPSTGEVLKGSDDILWHARDVLQIQGDRRIITSKFDNTGSVFNYGSLSARQQECLDSNSDVVDYLRGTEVTGFRGRTKILGDIVHSAPLLVGDTIYAGGNDGMLHAFNATTGEERFGYVPLHVYSYLNDLTKTDYEHRFYVDATPHAKKMTFYNSDGSYDQSKTYLMGGLKKGGRGIYMLDITTADTIDSSTAESSLTSMVKWEFPSAPVGLSLAFAGDQRADGVDNDGDNTIDEADEDYSDGYDNDGDGTVDEEGEQWLNFADDDMGYTFSDPRIVRSYRSTNEQYDTTDHPWIVVFGNGYESINGSAVLYIVDALTGSLIKKIDTGVSGNNGLSVPTIIDFDNDDRADYVYAGDLLGNMWKFDLTDADSANWGVAYADSSATPQPLFTATGQSITSAPDVMYHCSEDGYMVLFGTGKFLGEDDRSDITLQSIFGVWDYSNKVAAVSDGNDNDHDGDTDELGEEKLNPSAYLGTWTRSTNTLSNITGLQLLEQTEIDFRSVNSANLRTLSDNLPQWYVDSDGVPVSPAGYSSDSIDNDNDGFTDETGENIGNIGWYFDLPYNADSDGVDNDNDGTIDEADEAALLGERVIKDVLIRDGRLIVISFIPEDSPCTGGGSSIVHELDACDGSRLDEALFDINNDGLINDDDLIDIGLVDENGDTILVAPSGKQYKGILHSPVIVGDPDKENDRELKIFSSSAGTTEVMWEKKEKTGLYYWQEH